MSHEFKVIRKEVYGRDKWIAIHQRDGNTRFEADSEAQLRDQVKDFALKGKDEDTEKATLRRIWKVTVKPKTEDSIEDDYEIMPSLFD